MNGWEVSFGHAFRRWMYDVESFTSLLDAVGYTQRVMSDAGESKLAEFAELDRRIEGVAIPLCRRRLRDFASRPDEYVMDEA
jgi:hypothetical protein